MTFEHFLVHVVLPISLILNVTRFHFRKKKDPILEILMPKRVRENLTRELENFQYTPRNKKIEGLKRIVPSTIPQEKIVRAGFVILTGPDKYSITIAKSVEFVGYKALAHFWEPSEWWNLVGRSEKGRGIEGLLKILKEKQ